MVTITIWTNRLLREFDGIQEKLPAEASLLSHSMDPSEGVCLAVFGFQVPLASPSREGGGELDSGPAVTAKFKLEMDLSMKTSRYPFEPPLVRVVDGADALPASLLSGDTLVLPGADTWTPSNSILSALQVIVDQVKQRGSGGPGGGAQGGGGGLFAPGQTVATSAINSTLFPCKVQSPRGLLDRYLAVTDAQLLEVEAHRNRMNQVVVLAAHGLPELAKLKFRRGHSVVVMLKGGEGKEFFTAQAYQVVQAMTAALQQQGIAGHRTSAQAERQVDQARQIVQQIHHQEMKLTQNSSMEDVQLVMDLFRQAAELYSAVSDDRHQQVVEHMHKFLQRPEVLSILEGKPSPPRPPLRQLSGEADPEFHHDGRFTGYGKRAQRSRGASEAEGSQGTPAGAPQTDTELQQLEDLMTEAAINSSVSPEPPKPEDANRPHTTTADPGESLQARRRPKSTAAPQPASSPAKSVAAEQTERHDVTEESRMRVEL